ncbi:LysR substrate-binding domain-containing protein [Paraburkholderia sp.]|uniref:LysR substrate-binding domain-containing protein n=1 Tax=Paraburkholderia sp. TaxID=1926495 RepID=UPI0023847297|nr:LysR substrate-binding domain-containing protein [Paraburkholderia sp.]MDE1180958.1 LysR substrate-binding domain-containing protein [Paraburkholderia sp.]
MVNVKHLNARLRVKHMEMLLVLAEEGTIHKAAARLGMSQPGASKMLQELEALFETPIFLREASGLAPTAAGRLLIDRARLMLGEVQQMKADVEEVTQGVSGRVRVGFAAVAAPTILRAAIARMRQRAPRVAIEIQEGSISWLIDALLNGTVDCVLSRLSEATSSPKLTRESLYEEKVTVVARVGHPILDTTPVDVHALAAAEWILPARGAPMRESINRFFATHRLPMPQPAVESVSVMANLALLRSSDLLAYLPAPIAAEFSQLDALRIVQTQSDLEMPPVGLVLRKSDRMSLPTEYFVDAVRAATAEAFES